MTKRKNILCRIGLISVLLTGTCAGQAQVLTLEECRQMALQDNKTAQIDQEAVAAAEARRKAAFSNFFPKFSANGGYTYNNVDVHLLPLEHAGEYGTFHADGDFVWNDKDLVTITPRDGATNVEKLLVNDLNRQLNTELKSSLGPMLNDQYSRLYEELSLDFTHTLVGQVGVTQPIFVGGKIWNTYKIAKSTEAIAQKKQQMDRNDVIYNVDEAYWRVVSVEHKKALAQQYYDLLNKLSHDVDILVEEGMATRSDQLKVQLKKCEAEEKLGQATDGLVLSKMALCQVIGRDLNYDIHVDGSHLEDITLVDMNENLENAADKREEVQMLEEAKNIAKASKGLAASTLMPNVVASANYMMMNKNVEDGFDSNKFQGWVNAGIVVNIPIAHANDIYKVKAAKHEERMAELAVEEVREKLTLQATQSQQRVTAAQRKLTRTKTQAESAQEILRMAEESFREGVINSTDLMGAQTQWMSAESDRIDAAIELRLAELTYKKHTGKEL